MHSPVYLGQVGYLPWRCRSLLYLHGQVEVPSIECLMHFCALQWPPPAFLASRQQLPCCCKLLQYLHDSFQESPVEFLEHRSIVSLPLSVFFSCHVLLPFGTSPLLFQVYLDCAGHLSCCCKFLPFFYHQVQGSSIERPGLSCIAPLLSSVCLVFLMQFPCCCRYPLWIHGRVLGPSIEYPKSFGTLLSLSPTRLGLATRVPFCGTHWLYLLHGPIQRLAPDPSDAMPTSRPISHVSERDAPLPRRFLL
mmetsp:Transcript_21175/g.52074  ORF Transcript_21175/g.52074 Transcript_21175/m.52074 type:complete len:249 (-) Transcript_21175:474-1220(-)